MTFHHGISGRERTSGALPITTVATAVIGLIAYAPDADPLVFPLNTPVRVSSMSRALLSAGYTGTLRRMLEAMQPITNPTLVVIRIEDPRPAAGSPSSDFVQSNIIGQNVDGNRTGIQALLTAKTVLGLTPKILIAPELETPDVVAALAAVAKRLRAYCYVTPRDATGAMLPTAQQAVTYRQTLGDREIELIYPEWTSGNILLSPPSTGSGINTITLYSNQGSGQADLNPEYGDTVTVTVNGIDFVSEAWSEALESSEGSADELVTRVLQEAGLNVTPNVTGDITYEWTLTAPSTGSQAVAIGTSAPTRFKFRIAGEPLTNPVSFTLSSSTSNTPATYGNGVLNACATAAALRAELDEQVGWHKSISNVIVNGPTGISQALTWDLEDPDTDVGYLNANQVTSLINHQGFRFWGNRNCSADPRFSFEVATRTAQTILDTIIQGCFPFVDQPLNPILARDILDTVNARLRAWVTEGRLIGAVCWYDPNSEGNSTQALSQGVFWIDYDFTPVPTLENLGLNQRITDRYLVDFATLISATTQEA